MTAEQLSHQLEPGFKGELSDGRALLEEGDDAFLTALAETKLPDALEPPENELAAIAAGDEHAGEFHEEFDLAA